MAVHDADKICQALLGTFSSEAATRNEAESFLKSLSLTPNLFSTLLQILKHPEVDESVRVGAAVMLKNEVRSSWDGSLEASYSEEDKKHLRDNIYETLTLTHCDKQSVGLQLIESIRLIAFFDYPAQWEDLLDKLCVDISQRNDSNRLLCALTCLRKLAEKYEYKASSERDHLERIILKTFPLLIKAASDLCAIGLDNRESAMMLKLICKTYWSCTQMSLSKNRVILESLDDWMQLMEYLITAPVDVQSKGGVNAPDLPEYPQFKAKKWALQVIHRLFSRYATKSNVDPKDEMQKEFANKFLSAWAPRHTVTLLELLKQYLLGSVYLTDRVISLILQFLMQGVEIASIYKNHIKVQGEFLLFKVCFPLLCYNDKDVQLWEEDAVEFIRTQTDCIESFIQPKEAAIDFVSAIGRLRGVDFLAPMYNHVEKIFEVYETHKNNNTLTPELHRQKYGALYMFGCIADRLANKKRKVPIENLLEKHVLNELSSEDRFLRLRSCWALETYIPKVEDWNNTNNLMNAYRGMLRCTVDCEMPVRLQAGISIKTFFDVEVEFLQNAIVHSIPDLMKQLFVLMKDMDSELIVSTLDSLVSHYEMHICPYARELVEALTRTLIELLRKEAEGKDDSDDLVLAASSVLQTIKSVLDSIAEKPQMYVEVVEPLCPILDQIFLPDNIDQLEDGLEILTYLTYHVPEIPPCLWKYFEWMHAAVCGGKNDFVVLEDVISEGYAPDLLENMVAPLDNFMTRDFKTFNNGKNSSGVPYKQLVLEMAAKVLDLELEPHYGLELLCILFESCWESQSANEYIMPSVKAVWEWVTKNKTVEVDGLRNLEKKKVIKLFSVLMFYSPDLLFAVTENFQITAKVFDFIFAYAKCLKTADDRRFLVLGFTKVVEAVGRKEKEGTVCQLPQSIIADLKKIVCELSTQFIKLVETKQKGTNKSTEDGDSFVTDSVDSEQELEDYEDAVDTSDYRYSHKPAYGLGEDLSGGAGGDEGDDDDEEDDDDDLDGSFEAALDSDERISPLEAIKELDVINATFASLPDAMRLQIQNWLGVIESSRFDEALKTAASLPSQPAASST